MSQRLQQRIIKSKITFPLMVILALLLWIVGIEWPLTEEISLTGWWGTFNLPAWVVEGGNLLLCSVAAYLMAELNNSYALVGHRSTLHTSFLLLLWVSLPLSCHSLTGNLFLVCLLWSILFLFRCYQVVLPGEVAHLFFFIGISSLIQFPIVVFIPFLYAALLIFKALSIRTFCASLIGLLLPYWLLFAHAFWHGQMELFFAPWQSFRQSFVWDYSTISTSNWLTMGYTALLFLYSGSYVLTNGHRYKIRTRLFLFFLFWWSLFALLLWVLNPSAWSALAATPIIGVSILSGHVFAHSSTRVSNILFLVALVLLIVLSVYGSVWMLW